MQASQMPVIPAGAQIPEGATFYRGEDDKHCRVIRPDGERCGATRVKATGLCPAHSGVTDIAAHSHKGHAEKQRRKQARLTLGISARRASSPLQAARVAAQIRADDFARAVVDAPLDDPELGSVAKQQAAIRALEILYPQVTATLDVALPETAEGVASMGWQDMQALAASLTSTDQ